MFCSLSTSEVNKRVYKLERILSQLLLRISCCLDKLKPTGVPIMAVKGSNPIASSEFFLIVFAQKYCPRSAPVFMKSKIFTEKR